VQLAPGFFFLLGLPLEPRGELGPFMDPAKQGLAYRGTRVPSSLVSQPSTMTEVARLAAALGDRYVIERELGAGGMATVYLAQDRKHERTVALKVLRPDLAAVIGARRFLQEIRISARLDHPHILTLIDSGESDGFLWYVLPYVRGESLRAQLTREKQLSVDVAVGLGSQIAGALDYAHRHGVIHRDVKPENILLHEGEAVVADFGIALAVQEAGGPRLTETGLSLGTPHYMSPEQASGSQDLDARSDVYSLAAVVYEMLAGEPPHTGPTVPVIIAKLLTQTPIPLHVLRSTVPEALSQVVAKALAKVPSDRFATAVQFAQALERPLLAPSPGQAHGLKSIAVLPFTDMSAERGNEYFGEGMAEEIINALTGVDALRVAARTSSFAFKGQNVDARTIGQRLDVAAILEGSVRRAGERLRITAQLISVADGYHLWSQRYDRDMADVFAIQDEISRAIVDSLKVKLLGREDTTLVRPPTHNLDAYNLYLKGRFFWSQRGEGLLKALDCFAQAIENDPQYPAPLTGIADCNNMIAWYGLAPPREAFDAARDAALRALSIDRNCAEAHTSLAFVKMFHDWDWTGAEQEYLRALQLKPGYATAHHWYGEYLLAAGRFDEGIAEANRAQESDPLGLIIHAYRGLAFYFARRFDESIAICHRALEMEQSFIPTHLWLGLAWLGLANQQCGQLEDAVEVLQEAASFPNAGQFLLGFLGHAQGRAGRREDAQGTLEELHRLAGNTYVSPFSVALVLLGLGEREESLSWLEKASQERTCWLVWLGVDPMFDSLRDEPRFQAILAQMGLDRLLAR
jgi:eukaryotic-like serine/threonine-protein kinase